MFQHVWNHSSGNFLGKPPKYHTVANYNWCVSVLMLVSGERSGGQQFHKYQPVIATQLHLEPVWTCHPIKAFWQLRSKRCHQEEPKSKWRGAGKHACIWVILGLYPNVSGTCCIFELGKWCPPQALGTVIRSFPPQVWDVTYQYC